jgi:hypothetical protein
MIKIQASALLTFVFLLLSTFSYQSSAQSSSKPATAKAKPAPSTKQELKFFKLKDSSFERWNIIEPQEIYSITSFGNVTMDTSGALYSVITESDGSHHAGKLLGNQWIAIDSAIETPVEKILNDGNGVVYAKTGKQLYRLDGQRWAKVFDSTAKGLIPWPALSGSLYREIPIHNSTYDWISSELVKFESGKDISIGINGKPFIVDRKTKYYIDRRGYVYTVSDNPQNKWFDPPKKEVLISMLNGETRPFIGSLPYPVMHSGFDADNNWYVSGYDGKDGETAYFKKWDGKDWTDIPMPPGIRTDNTFSVADFFFDTKGNLYLRGMGLDQFAKLIAFKDGKWKEVCSAYDEPPYIYMHVDEFIVGKNSVYGIHYGYNTTEKKDYVEAYKLTGVWKVNTMEVARIPLAPDVHGGDLYIGYSNFVDHYLFRENGKYGIQDNKGHVFAEAVFDKITCRKTPAHVLAVQGEELLNPFSDYSYELISGKDTIYAQIGYFSPNPGTLIGLKGKVSSVCRYCNGTGKVAERKEQVQVRGDWVKERATTGTNITYDNEWDAMNRRNVTVKTTTTTTRVSGGYYKPDTYKTIIIPGGKCMYCGGQGKGHSYEIYEFDKDKGIYVKNWK